MGDSSRRAFLSQATSCKGTRAIQKPLCKLDAQHCFPKLPEKNAVDDIDDCSTKASSDAGSDSRTSSDFSSEARSGSSDSGSEEKKRHMTRVCSLPPIRKTLPVERYGFKFGNLGLNSRRTARREESRKLCERRPKSNMLRRRYEHCLA